VNNDSKALSNDSVWSLYSRNWKIIIQRYVAHSISIMNVGAHYWIIISCYLFSCLCNFHFIYHTANKIPSIGISIGIGIDSPKISGIGIGISIGWHQTSGIGIGTGIGWHHVSGIGIGIGIGWNFGIGTSLTYILCIYSSYCLFSY